MENKKIPIFEELFERARKIIEERKAMEAEQAAKEEDNRDE